MAKRLIIHLQDDYHIRYGYETGLRAVCEAIRKELGSNYDKLDVEIIEEPPQSVDN